MGSAPTLSTNRRHSSRKSHPSALAVASSAPLDPQNGAMTPNTATPNTSKSHASAPTPAGAKTTLGAGVKVLPGGGGIFKSAAVAVLRIERKLMSTGDICRVALERGLLQAKGKTPEATMASALYTDVKRKEKKSIFTRPQEGLFGLQEWEDEGFVPEAMVPGGGGPSDTRTPGSHTAMARSPKRDPRRSGRRQRWNDEESLDVTDSPGRTDTDSPAMHESKRRIAMTELPGKQRLKHALRMQQEREDLQSERDTPTSSHPTHDSHVSSGKRKKPRLQVEVPSTGGAGIQSINGGTAKSPHPDLLHGLDASRLIGSGGGIGMEGPGLGSTFLPVSLESGAQHLLNTSSSLLRSPLDAAILGALDTPALMNMQIPDGLPLTPEGLAAAAIRSGLTPRWGLTPRVNSSSQLASPGPLSNRWPQHQMQHNDQSGTPQGSVQFKAPDAPEASPHPALRSAAAAAETTCGSQWPTAAQRMASVSSQSRHGLDEMERRVLTLERSLGRNHPQVGKAWVFLGRTIQSAGGPDAAVRAERALLRAQEIFTACTKQLRRPNSNVEESFDYLLDKVRALSTGSAGGAQTGAAE
mmetsp:Transcript_33602/g.60094  ORF Transcript_33602/g.60094 Transcript_33602/m.60094 type:complete len:583 (-) Transcript_33602:140-1888(-)